MSVVFALGIKPQTFPDVPAGSYYENAVTKASNEGWVTGYANGLFGPSDNISRADLVTILDRYNQKVEENTQNLKLILCDNKDNASNNVKTSFSSDADKQTYETALQTFCSKNLLPTDSGCEMTYDPKTGSFTIGICK